MRRTFFGCKSGESAHLRFRPNKRPYLSPSSSGSSKARRPSSDLVLMSHRRAVSYWPKLLAGYRRTHLSDPGSQVRSDVALTSCCRRPCSPLNVDQLKLSKKTENNESPHQNSHRNEPRRKRTRPTGKILRPLAFSGVPSIKTRRVELGKGCCTPQPTRPSHLFSLNQQGSRITAQHVFFRNHPCQPSSLA